MALARITDDGTIDLTRAALAGTPKQIETARRRATRKLTTWVRRQVLRAISKRTGLPQKGYRVSLRYAVRNRERGLSVWIGTNPVAARWLGTIRQTRRGVRAGRRLFPDAWIWRRRIYQRNAQGEPEPITVAVHDAVADVVEGLLDQINERYGRLLQQELRYAIELEGRRR